MKRSWRSSIILCAAFVNVLVLLPGDAHAVLGSTTCGGATEVATQADVIQSSDHDLYWKHTATIYPKHTFTLTMTGGDVDLFVYSESSCSSLECSSQQGGTTTDSCTPSLIVTPLTPWTFYIRVHYYAGIPAGNSIDYTISANASVI
jgi:hypothetical protein